MSTTALVILVVVLILTSEIWVPLLAVALVALFGMVIAAIGLLFVVPILLCDRMWGWITGQRCTIIKINGRRIL